MKNKRLELIKEKLKSVYLKSVNATLKVLDGIARYPGTCIVGTAAVLTALRICYISGVAEGPGL